MTESAAKKAAEPFRYKARPKLEPGDGMLEQMVQLGMLRVNQHTAAAVLGCSADTLRSFWTAHPEYRDAYDAGQQLDNVRTSRLLRMHAVSDPATARFLAKNYLELSDDPSKARLDEESTKALKSRTPEETRARIQEILGKLKVIEHEPASRETSKDEQKQGDVRQTVPESAVRRAGVPSDGSGDRGQPVRASSAPQGRQVLQRPLKEGLAQPEAHGKGQSQGSSPVVAELQKRLSELEASAVRKNPRRDGQPHTDRTKANSTQLASSSVDNASNKPQEGRPYAPARLPGRLGSRG